MSTSDQTKSSLQVTIKDASALVDDPIDKHAPLIVRSLIIGSGVAGMCLIARSVRFFTQFGHVRDIPEEFFKKHFTLRGSLDAVTQDAKLRVVHKSLGKLPKWLPMQRTVTGKLTLRLAGLEVTETGRSWMMNNFGGRPIRFTLVKRVGPDEIDCDVSIKQGFLRRMNLNQQLVRKGMARMRGLEDEQHVEALKTNSEYSRLVSRLIISERWADRRGIGMWQREGWLEALRSYPSQAKDILQHGTLYRVSATLAKATSDMAVVAFKGGKIVAAATVEVLKESGAFVWRILRYIKDVRSGQAS